MIVTSYTYHSLEFSYSYASFIGGENSDNEKAELVEHDFVLEYNVNSKFLLHGALSISEDLVSTVMNENDWTRFHIAANYIF